MFVPVQLDAQTQHATGHASDTRTKSPSGVRMELYDDVLSQRCFSEGMLHRVCWLLEPDAEISPINISLAV